jgi:hypothetical protein
MSVDALQPQAFAGLSSYRRIVNDLVIYDSDETQHTDYVRQFLQAKVNYTKTPSGRVLV